MDDGIHLTNEQKKTQRSRSRAIGILLAVFVIIIYIATWLKLANNIHGGS